MSWSLDGTPIGSVLVTRLRYLGDIVMSTVVLAALKRGDPGLVVGYLCESEHAPVLAGHPDLDRLHVLGLRRSGSDAKARSAAGGRPAKGAGAWNLVRDLRRARYDLAVDLFFNPRSAWLLKLSGIPRRIGGTTKWRRRLYSHTVLRDSLGRAADTLAGIAPGGLGDHLCRLAPLMHVESGMPFLEWLFRVQDGEMLKPRIRVPAVTPQATRLCAGAGVDPASSYLVLAPGATWRSKEWPLERWRELIRLIQTDSGHQVAVLPPPGGQDRWSSLGSDIRHGGGGLLPVMGLEEALAVVGAARGLIAVDGGLMHAAVGMGVPTVALFGPTDPGIWFPYRRSGPFEVLATAPTCHPCDLLECPNFICLPDLAPERVFEALQRVLDGASHAAGGPL